jgi:hypothetical protein
MRRAMILQSGKAVSWQVKRSKGEFNVQSRCNENENLSPNLSSVGGIKHTAMK